MAKVASKEEEDTRVVSIRGTRSSGNSQATRSGRLRGQATVKGSSSRDLNTKEIANNHQARSVAEGEDSTNVVQDKGDQVLQAGEEVSSSSNKSREEEQCHWLRATPGGATTVSGLQ